jgi:hypothetical protein
MTVLLPLPNPAPPPHAGLLAMSRGQFLAPKGTFAVYTGSMCYDRKDRLQHTKHTKGNGVPLMYLMSKPPKARTLAPSVGKVVAAHEKRQRKAAKRLRQQELC